jgi:hypothetical protein
MSFYDVKQSVQFNLSLGLLATGVARSLTQMLKVRELFAYKIWDGENWLELEKYLEASGQTAIEAIVEGR